MLTRFWTRLRPHAKQSDLWRTKARFVGVCAGRGSGKTDIARRRVVRLLAVRKPWPDPEYFYALPTQGQARRVAWQAIKSLVPEDWLDGEPNESSMVITTKFGSKLRVFGLDKPHRVEGLQYDGGVIDESSDQKPGTFDRTFRPALTHRRGWCWRIGVPKRFGVGAAEFREFCELAQKLRREGDSSYDYFNWPSGDILPPEELEANRKAMDDKDFNEQFGASWETVAGLVYYAFDRVVSVVDRAYEPSVPLIVGSDFNVDPMSWVVMQMIGDTFYVIDEIYEHNTNTQRTLDMLYNRYGSHEGGFVFIGDATGRARKTSAASSDYVQIKSDTRFKNSKVYYPNVNPPVADRVAAVNACLRNALGQRNLFVHSRCVHVIKDFEYLSYDAGTREICQSDKSLKHISDALGYPISVLRPVRYETPQDAQVGIM